MKKYVAKKTRFIGDSSIVFKGRFIIPNIMTYSINQGGRACWRSKFENYLKLYAGDFGQVNMKTLKAELDLRKEHWRHRKNCLSDSISTTLNSIKT